MKNAPPAEVEIKMTVEQARACKQALDLYSRMAIGQLEALADLVRDGTIPVSASSKLPREMAPTSVTNDVQGMLLGAKRLLGYPENGSNGIGHPHVHITAHRAYEVQKVLAKALVGDTPAMRHTVDNDGLLVRYTNDPAPSAKMTVLAADDENAPGM